MIVTRSRSSKVKLKEKDINLKPGVEDEASAAVKPTVKMKTSLKKRAWAATYAKGAGESAPAAKPVTKKEDSGNEEAPVTPVDLKKEEGFALEKPDDKRKASTSKKAADAEVVVEMAQGKEKEDEPLVLTQTKVEDATDASNESADVLIWKRSYSGKAKKWSTWQAEYRRPNEEGEEFAISLKLGGMVRVYPSLLPPSDQIFLTKELKDNETCFRQYRIQGTEEPRAHFLLHEGAPDHAIDDPHTKSPGYKYGQITMKARPLHLLPHLKRFSDRLKDKFQLPFWNVGVNVICYRDGHDSMGFHADNDQEEKLIVTVIVSSPPKPRQVLIKRMPASEKSNKRRNGNSKSELSHVQKRAGPCDGDEEIRLSLRAGDAYSMDGKMQKSYVHGVPKDNDCLSGDNNSGDSKADRMAIVFRHGDYKEYTKDSGQFVLNLLPRTKLQRCFGQMDCLTEGVSYCRVEIHEMGAHRSPQGGVSGNKKEGCDAIIMSGARKDGFGDDFFEKIMYAAHTQVGAGGILTSMGRQIPIRVFRSSRLDNEYAAQVNQKKQSAQYRYDGLYRLVRVRFDDGSGDKREETPKSLSPLIAGNLYKFQLARIEVGEDAVSNRKSTDEMLEEIGLSRHKSCANTLLSLARGDKRRRKK